LPEIPVREGWKAEVIALQPPRGQARYLVAVWKERCPSCSRGVRTLSVWGTLAGLTEEVAWCAHCFNATCQPVPPGAAALQQLHLLRQVVDAGPAPLPWPAARPALEDLERRGLL
jgi:hypothetical protein